MKFANILAVSFMTAGMAISLSGCGSNDVENRRNVPNLPSFALITDGADNVLYDTSISTEISYELFDYTVGLTVSNLDIPGKQSMTLRTGDVTCKQASDGAMYFTQTDINTPAGLINSLNVTAYPRLDNSGNMYSFLNAWFMLDNQYTVRIVDNACRWYGYTTVTTDGEPEPYKTYDPEYVVNFNPDKATATLYIYSARFAAAMPQAFDMIFSDIPFTMDRNGYALHIDSLVPKIGEKPYERYMITNLNVIGNFNDNTLSVSFDCAGRYHVGSTMKPILKIEK